MLYCLWSLQKADYLVTSRSVCVDTDFRALRRWVQQNPFQAEIVAVEHVPASTRLRVKFVSQLQVPNEQQCREDFLITSRGPRNNTATDAHR